MRLENFFQFLLALNVIFCGEFDGFLEIEDENGNLNKQDLIEFIENGKQLIDNSSNSQTKENAIMILGLSGTGKTTLVNYLNNIPLVCKLIDDSWRVDLESDSNTLPGGFKIGHKGSETHFPSVYTPNDKEFSYIDNPGFQDDRGVAFEISNSFFREHITRKTSNIKFLVLLSSGDLDSTSNRGAQTRNTVEGFFDMLGVFEDDEKVKSLSKSIGIIVTRVDNQGKSDDEMKTLIGNKLQDILNRAKKAKKLHQNVVQVFEDVIQNNQIEVITKCEEKFKNKIIDHVQKDQVILLVNKLSYFDKTTAQFRLKLGQDIDSIYSYTQERYGLFKAEVENKTENNLIEYVQKGLVKTKTIEGVNVLDSELGNIKRLKSTDLESLLNSLGSKIIDDELKKKLIEKKNLFDYFVKLLPNKMLNHVNENFLTELRQRIELKINDQIDLLNRLKKNPNVKLDDQGLLTVDACYLKSSEIENLLGPKVKHVSINLCQAIYFNKDVNLRGVNSLTIIAPKWIVEKSIKINIDLSGLNGDSHSNLNAGDGVGNGSPGRDGIPGQPGKNGGKFVGFGNSFENIGN